MVIMGSTPIARTASFMSGVMSPPMTQLLTLGRAAPPDRVPLCGDVAGWSSNCGAPWRSACVVLAQSSTRPQDAALFAEMLSLPNDGRYPTLELEPQQRRQKTPGEQITSCPPSRSPSRMADLLLA